VALLTVDESMLAGVTNTYNQSHYLFTNKSWWILSPFSFIDDKTSGLFVNYYGSLNDHNLNVFNGVRPAISLAPGSIVGGGYGSSDDPFTVDLDPSIS